MTRFTTQFLLTSIQKASPGTRNEALGAKGRWELVMSEPLPQSALPGTEGYAPLEADT